MIALNYKIYELNKDSFSKGLKELGFTSVAEMVIELQDAEPVAYSVCLIPRGHWLVTWCRIWLMAVWLEYHFHLMPVP